MKREKILTTANYKKNKNILNVNDFGYNILGRTVGETWISLVESILKHGEVSYDEKRGRLALMNIRVKSKTQEIEDEIINTHAEKEKCNAMIDFMFSKEIIEDIDIIKSFHRGAKSYYQRMKEGKMLEFVVKRLSAIPESKKAAIIFPTYEDYAKILKDQYINDYLPCIVAIQFRLIRDGKGYILNTNFYSRSIDAYQKAHGNLLSIAKLSNIVANEVSRNINKKVSVGFLDGFIADAHIYKETFDSARKAVDDYKNGL